MNTNDLNQVFENAAVVKTQVQANWPMICAASVIVARELRNFNQWVVNVAEFLIRHGGILLILKKLVWNVSPSDRLAIPPDHEDAIDKINRELAQVKPSGE